MRPFFFLAGGLRPAGPPLAVARGAPQPRSAPAAHSLNSFAPHQSTPVRGPDAVSARSLARRPRDTARRSMLRAPPADQSHSEPGYLIPPTRTSESVSSAK